MKWLKLFLRIFRAYEQTQEPEPTPPPPPVEPSVEPPPPEPLPEPEHEPEPDLLRGAIIASNSAQDIADFPETSRITSVKITEQEICIEHTKRGWWPTWWSKSANSLVEGSVWIFAEIDVVLHGATYESKRPKQRCKALTPENDPGTNIAERLGPHIKQGPLRDWVPKAGEKVWFLESTPARNRDERIAPKRERSNLYETTWPDFGGTEEPEPTSGEPYEWNLPDHEAVNSAEFINAITAHGPGAGNLTGSDGVKKRWNPSHPDLKKAPHYIRDDNGTLRAEYWPMPGWPPTTGKTGVWGHLHFVMKIGDRYESRRIFDLWRGANTTAFDIADIWALVEDAFGIVFDGDSGSLCAWWISGANIKRRTDLHPWRR